MTRHLLNAMESLRRHSEGVGQQVINALEELQKMFESPERKGTQAISRMNEHVHQEEIKINEECLKIQALYQPAGQPLRTLSSHLKVSECLERISARALNISYLVNDLKTRQEYRFPPSAFELARRMTHLASKTVQALAEEDLIEAKAICMGDPLLAELKKIVEDECFSGLEQEDLPFLEKIKVIRVILEYEFIEEVLCCVAKDTVYLVTGEVLRPQADRLAVAFQEIDQLPEIHEISLRDFRKET